MTSSRANKRCCKIPFPIVLFRLPVRSSSIDQQKEIQVYLTNFLTSISLSIPDIMIKSTNITRMIKSSLVIGTIPRRINAARTNSAKIENIEIRANSRCLFSYILAQVFILSSSL